MAILPRRVGPGGTGDVADTEIAPSVNVAPGGCAALDFSGVVARRALAAWLRSYPTEGRWSVETNVLRSAMPPDGDGVWKLWMVRLAPACATTTSWS